MKTAAFKGSLFFSAALFFQAALIVFAAGLKAQTAALDADSLACLKCHESSAAAADGQLTHGGGYSHPLGMDYAYLASKNPGLKKPGGLNPAIRLSNNRVGCLSCHVPYSEYDHEVLARARNERPELPDPMLSVDNTASGLCVSCHNK